MAGLFVKDKFRRRNYLNVHIRGAKASLNILMRFLVAYLVLLKTRLSSEVKKRHVGYCMKD